MKASIILPGKAESTRGKTRPFNPTEDKASFTLSIPGRESLGVMHDFEKCSVI